MGDQPEQTARRSFDLSVVDTEIKHGSLNTFTTCLFIFGILAGSGCLALPKSMDNTGVAGIPLTLSFCILCTYTSKLLGKCWVILLERGLLPPSGHVRYPYPTIGEVAYGKSGRILVQTTTNLANFGTVIVYILMSSNNIESLISPYTSLSMCYIAPIISGCVIPVAWLGTPKDFWGTALATCLSSFATSVLIFANILHDRHKYPTVVHSNVSFVSIFMAFGTMVFAYGGHTVYPTVIADMKEPKKFTRASIVAYLATLTIYLPSPIASFYIYGKNVDANVLNSISAGPVRTLATVLTTVHLVLGIIMVGNPVFQELEHLLNVPIKKFTVKRAITRTCVCLCALFIAETIPHFSAVLALVGGSTFTFLAFICPSLFYLKLASKTPEVGDTWKQRRVPVHIKVLNYVIPLAGVLCGVAATYSAIHDIVHSSFSVPCYVNPSRASI